MLSWHGDAPAASIESSAVRSVDTYRGSRSHNSKTIAVITKGSSMADSSERTVSFCTTIRSFGLGCLLSCSLGSLLGTCNHKLLVCALQPQLVVGTIALLQKH